MPLPERSVIIHVHILKNAGSTFDWSLKHFFGNSFYTDLIDQQVVDGPLLTSIIRSDKNIKAISSHNIQLPLPIIENVNLIPVFFIRHPLLRAVSVYQFERRQARLSGKPCEASAMTLAEYIEWRLDARVMPIIRNCQTQYCLGKISGKAFDLLETAQYEMAVNQLHQSPLVGIVEQYDKSMIIFNECCRDIFPGINFSYVKQNIAGDSYISIDEKLKVLKNEIGDSLYQALCDANQYDLLLFEQAGKMVDERFSKIKNAHLKLCMLHSVNVVLSVREFVEKVKRNVRRRLNLPI